MTGWETASADEGMGGRHRQLTSGRGGIFPLAQKQHMLAADSLPATDKVRESLRGPLLSLVLVFNPESVALRALSTYLARRSP